MKVWFAAAGTLVALALSVRGVGAGTAMPTRVSATDPAAAVRAVLAAPGLVDYEGTKVVTAVRGDRAETVTILESYKRLGKLRLEFLSPESVSGRLIVDDGASAWQYEPSLHLVVRGPSFAAPTAADPDAILRRYAAAVLGTEPVIGRSTIVLSLVPRSGGLSRRLWVDQATGVILRTEERSAAGEILFTSFFTRISYSLNLPSALFRFHLPAGARVLSFYLSGDPLTDRQALSRQAGFSVIAPPALAGEFRFRDGTVARYGAFSAATAVYTDGVTALTVYQTQASKMVFPQSGVPIALGKGEGRLLDLGYFRVLMWQSRGLSLAVVGTLPPAQLVQIADELNTVAR